MSRSAAILARALSCLLLGRAAAAAAAEPAIELAYRFVPGAVESHRIDSDEQIEMTSSVVPGLRHRVRSQSRLVLTRRVLSCDADAAALELSFSQAEGSVDNGGRERPAAHLEALAKTRISVRQNIRGEYSEARLKDAEALDPAARGMAEEFAASLSRSALVFPGRPLAAGERWEVRRSIRLPIPGAEDFEAQWTVAYRLSELPASPGGEALIQAEFGADVDENRGRDGAILSTRIQASGTGEFRFRPDTGRLVSGRFELTVAGEIRRGDGGPEISHRVTMKLGSETKAL